MLHHPLFPYTTLFRSRTSMNQRNEIFLQAADNIGTKLCRDALWADKRCNWLGDSMDVVDRAWQVVHRAFGPRSEEHTSELQSRQYLVCRLLLENKKTQ